MTPWLVRQYLDDRGVKPVEAFFEVPGSAGISRSERARFLARLALVQAFGLSLLSLQPDVFESVRGQHNLYSIRLNRMPNNPRILACAIPGKRCVVLLHAFKELDRKAYARAVPVAVARRDRVTDDSLRWTSSVSMG